MTVSLRRSFSFCAAAGAALILSSCVPAAVAGVAVGAGIAASVLISNCHEPVSVQVWDHTSSHPVCDAEVVAEQDGSVTTFSPCYQTYLGTGTWKITATKRGIGTATGLVEISKDRKCDEPAFHSVDLTIGTDAAQSTPPPVPPPVTYPSAPPATSATAAPPATSAPPATPPPASTSTVPSAAFPPPASPTSPGTEVPAPPTK